MVLSIEWFDELLHEEDWELRQFSIIILSNLFPKNISRYFVQRKKSQIKNSTIYKHNSNSPNLSEAN